MTRFHKKGTERVPLLPAIKKKKKNHTLTIFSVTDFFYGKRGSQKSTSDYSRWFDRKSNEKPFFTSLRGDLLLSLSTLCVWFSRAFFNTSEFEMYQFPSTKILFIFFLLFWFVIDKAPIISSNGGSSGRGRTNISGDFQFHLSNT